jgi:hypothetical protein
LAAARSAWRAAWLIQSQAIMFDGMFSLSTWC